MISEGAKWISSTGHSSICEVTETPIAQCAKTQGRGLLQGKRQWV